MSTEAEETRPWGGEPEHVIYWREPSIGFEAVLVIDSLRRGPGAGGIRTLTYPSIENAERDARGLARAMTLKCALSGLDAGGAKAVVQLTKDLDRQKAFACIGRRIQSLGGLFRTAGDLGTTTADLEAAAEHTEYVHTDEPVLADSVALGHLCTLHAALDRLGLPKTGLSVAVQGLGAIGKAVATRLHQEGFELTVSDLSAERTAWAKQALDARVVSPDALLSQPVDIVAPCAIGGVVDEKTAREVRARVVCGGANRILKGEAGAVLQERQVLFVPDLLSSAGAVIDGVGRTVMGLSDRTALIRRLEKTTRKVFRLMDDKQITPEAAATEFAWGRVEATEPWNGMKTSPGVESAVAPAR